MNNQFRYKLLMLLILFFSINIYAQEELKSSNAPSKVIPEKGHGSESILIPPMKKESNELDLLTIDYDLILANQNVQYCLPAFQVLFGKLKNVPDLNQDLASGILNSKNNFVEMFHYGFRMLGAPAGGFGPPVGGSQNRHKIEFASKKEDEKIAYLLGRMEFKFIEGTEVDWKKLSPELRREILNLIYTVDRVAVILQQFNQPIIDELLPKYPDFEKQYEEILIQPYLNRQLNNFATIDVIEKVDLRKLSFSSRLLNEGIREFIRVKNRLKATNFSHCFMDTKWGKIGIYGSQSDTINENYCLLIDMGGNDTYLGNSASSISLKKPIGILIDFEGDDRHNSKGSIAKGTLGIGALFDLDGDDEYYSEKSGLASSLFGSSILYDASGKDKYVSNAIFSQGAAHIGNAILCDLSGNDIYKSKSYSQAYGGTLGCGMFIDFEGDDIYGDLEDAEINHTSFVQGSAKGRWAEATDGQSLAGGIGMLLDFAGDDQYYANSFSQAASYYFGLGYLYDQNGNDQYNSATHSQGYSAHYSLSAFLDKLGDDLYNSLINEGQISQMIGSGRDFASGWLIDYSGNDEYNFGNRSAGIGDMNGIGIFWDLKGDDSYIHHQNNLSPNSPSLGQSIPMSSQMLIDFRLFKSQNTFNIGMHIDKVGKNIIKENIIR